MKLKFISITFFYFSRNLILGIIKSYKYQKLKVIIYTIEILLHIHTLYNCTICFFIFFVFRKFYLLSRKVIE